MVNSVIMVLDNGIWFIWWWSGGGDGEHNGVYRFDGDI